MDSDSETRSTSVLNLSKQCLKKIPKTDEAQSVKTLILDDNELQKIDNIDSYSKIEKLSLCKNQLLRMYGVCRLQNLRELNLSFNGIITIEGLKELAQLTTLNLEGNNIKTIEHLNTNFKLEFINLSENSIGIISDISFLKNLKELHLHGNRISHLRQCEKYLPTSLETLTLSKNNITDLNEICSLCHLSNLEGFSIAENPCVQMTGNTVTGFDYRPFVLNWIMSLKLIDGYVVNPIESLKAEWLYSQGRGRQFRIGEQTALARYLATVCSLSGETLENENERKLRLILSKAQQHQRQLQEEICGTDTTTSGSNSPNSSRRKGVSSRIQSPRFSRLGGRLGSPESSMCNSFSGISSNQFDPMTTSIHPSMSTSLMDNMKLDSNIMSQSLDPTSLNNQRNLMQQEILAKNLEQPLSSCPLMAASKMMPVPESLMSPDCYPTNKLSNANMLPGNNGKMVLTPKPNKGSPKTTRNSTNIKRDHNSSPHNTRKICHNRTDSLIKNNKQSNNSTPVLSSDEDNDQINVEKLKSIRNKAAQKVQQQQQMQKDTVDAVNAAVTKTTENSAILIQKMWRGFHTRKKTRNIVEKLQKKRTHDYITKLSQDMETTKAALEHERKIQQLQMQAIHALWKKVSQMGPTPTTTTIVDATSQLNIAPGNSNHPSSADDITNPSAVVQDLAKTCTVLTNQVQQLQGSMRDVLNCITLFCNISQNNTNAMQKQSEKQSSKGIAEKVDSCSTQTEIIAVNTPQVENLPFPFVNKLPRPSTLPLDATLESSQNTAPQSDVIIDDTIRKSPIIEVSDSNLVEN